MPTWPTRTPSMPDLVNGRPSSSNVNDACLGKEQQAALKILLGFSDDAIKAFIIYARSIDCPLQGTATQKHSGILSSEQLNAINLLKGCSYPLIVSRRACAQPTSTSAYDATPSQWPQGSISMAEYSSRINMATPVSSQHLSLTDVIPSNASRNEDVLPPVVGPQVTCWCTYCPQPRRFETKDGWARHEREKHEKHVYPCMPNGAIESTAQGPKCAICQMVNPDEDHPNLHKVASCLETSLTNPVYRRRIDLVNHLKIHGVSQGQDLAEKWKCTPKKKAWACGFCVKYFQQRMDRINHIFTDHYAHGVDIRSWDHGKVIQGLLHQPPLWDFWLNLLASKPPYTLPEIAWSASVAKQLQTRLEMGEESPEILVAAAYQQSNLGVCFRDSDLAFRGADTALAMNTGQGPRHPPSDSLQPSNQRRTADVNSGFLDWSSCFVFNDEMWNES